MTTQHEQMQRARLEATIEIKAALVRLAVAYSQAGAENEAAEIYQSLADASLRHAAPVPALRVVQ